MEFAVAQLIILILGAVLIAVGLALVTVQFWTRTVQGSASEFMLRTTYPGLIIIALGVVLEIVVYLK